MIDFSEHVSDLSSATTRGRPGPAFLIYFHILACCVSLAYAARFHAAILQSVSIDESRLYAAAVNTAPIALVSVLFTIARFSFGYMLGFSFYTMVLGYLWLVEFSKLHYDHTLAIISAFACALAFLIPALFITSPIRQVYIFSRRAIGMLLASILVLATATLAIGATYNMRLVGLAEIYNFRDQLEFPVLLAYAMSATSNVLLPFAFACFVARGNRGRAALTLLLLLLFYPVTLTKVALFAPFWLLFLALLSGFFEARTAVVLSLLAPTLIGVILVLLFKFDTLTYEQIILYFATINFRMIAVPSSALDLYNHFFSTHDLTYFCQVNFIKTLTDCPYSQPLALVMQNAYHVGNFNASLFATEGIASVGPALAPFVVLACGLVISLGNRLSSGLPPRFILLSGGVLPQTFLNIPLTITLLTNGAALLLLLWYFMPRAMFEQNRKAEAKPNDDAGPGRAGHP